MAVPGGDCNSVAAVLTLDTHHQWHRTHTSHPSQLTLQHYAQFDLIRMVVLKMLWNSLEMTWNDVIPSYNDNAEVGRSFPDVYQDTPVLHNPRQGGIRTGGVLTGFDRVWAISGGRVLNNYCSPCPWRSIGTIRNQIRALLSSTTPAGEQEDRWSLDVVFLGFGWCHQNKSCSILEVLGPRWIYLILLPL